VLRLRPICGILYTFCTQILVGVKGDDYVQGNFVYKKCETVSIKKLS